MNDLLAIVLTYAVLAVPLALAWTLLREDRPRGKRYSALRGRKTAGCPDHERR